MQIPAARASRGPSKWLDFAPKEFSPEVNLIAATNALASGDFLEGVSRQLFDFVYGFAPDVSNNARPCPWETMTRPCAVSQAAVTPWQRPPTRLCRLSMTSPSSSILAMRP